MIAIVGAGPAGSYLAYLLARQGKEVSLFEEHKSAGLPVQCTGIVTNSIEKFFKLKKSVIANQLRRVIVVSRDKKISIDVDEIVMWRDKFDVFVSDMAQKEGAKIFLNHKFMGFGEADSIMVKDKEKNDIRQIKADAIVGADGPYSSVAKSAGMEPNRKNYIGIQAKVRLKMDSKAFETYFGSEFPNFFGWCVPESEDTARLGVGCLNDAKDHFYRFLEKRTGKKEILCWESGLIPVYDPKKSIQKGNIYLIGDAAGQTKATTGGGIIPSLKSAQVLCDCIVNAKDYNKEYRRKYGRELSLHLKIREILNRFSDDDYGKLLGLMAQEKIKKILRSMTGTPRYSWSRICC